MNLKLRCLCLTLAYSLFFFSVGNAKIAVHSSEKPVELKNKSFLQPSELLHLYQKLIGFIEAYDAEGIVTRELTKSINWQSYKAHKQKAFVKSKDWQQLKSAFDQLMAGFVNLHTRFRFNKSFAVKPRVNTVKLGFTYPEVSFFNQQDGEVITVFNEKKSAEAFNEFEQYSCRFNSKIGCLRSFVSHFNKGKLLVNEQPLITFTQAKQVFEVKYKAPSPDKMSGPFTAIKVDRYHGWEVLANGYKVAVLKQPGLLLLRIKNFRYKQGSGADFRCVEPAEEQSMCADIQLIRHVFDQANTNDISLIIDVQNNGGGKENTAFIAELSQAPFKDLMVNYKNTPLLQDEALRAGLFYGSGRAENWFGQLTKKDMDSSQEWLPSRADFCRANPACKLEWIEPNSKRKFKGVFLLTDESCVSSCDDLVWRMNEYSGAKVFGLPQAADATYSRISATFYLDSDKRIQHLVHPDGSSPEINGTVVFSLTIPYSRTVTSTGQLRQGRAAPTTFLLPISVNNYKTHGIDSLNYLATQVRAGQFND